MSAPLVRNDSAPLYRFWVTDGSVTREFCREVPAEVMLDLEQHSGEEREFLRRALADPRFDGRSMSMAPA